MSAVRQPRLLALVNGTALPGAISAEIQGSGAFQADHFRLETALNADNRFGLDFWTGAGMPVIDIRFSLDGGVGFTSLLVGQVDRIVADPINGLVTVEGRDLSARLIDAQTDEGFANQTSSDVASVLAQRHGLQVAVTQTTTLTGRYYQSDHHQIGFGRFSHIRSEWDLLVDLARREGFSVFVDQQTLYFQQPEAISPFIVQWDRATRRSNVERLRLTWLPAVASGVMVTVKSWHSKQGSAVSARAGSAGEGSGGVVGAVLRANLTESDAQQLAERYAAEIEGQSRSVSFDLPGELSLSPRSIIQLDGDVAGWGGLYRVVDVTRRLDINGGFTQTVSARGYATV